MTVNLLDISKVTEIFSDSYLSESGYEATKKVNDLLDRGWKLLKIYTTCYDHDVAPHQQTIHYVLGIDKGRNQANEDWDNGLISGPPQNK
ncbi:hypothetical protein KQI38_07495 [Tissierella carlieri]|uniref:hypothetical protein n=1 Tax=Tissierella carlieri TaxID=689904 RepID=UPI001C111949|nr:hypothetical protein [Tissierella carlieri]MBU5311870.1 hypothetical protein [Tissierella carlieri]